MTLESLSTDIESAYEGLDTAYDGALDRQTKNELAVLQSALGVEETDELVRRAIHQLFQRTVETGDLDFHLRRTYDLTYDEYLSGMTYDEMRGGNGYEPATEDDRRYQF